MKKYNFKKDNFTVIKNAISDDLAYFVYQYFLLKRIVAKTLMEKGIVAPNAPEWGTWQDPQVPLTYSIYGDQAMDTLLLKCQDIMEQTTNLKLIPTYAYARLYKEGDVLHKHKDRPSCEISTTLNLGGDPWPIYIEPDSKKGKHDKQGNYKPSKSKGIEVLLEPGDMLVYKGMMLEHWREAFDGDCCGQVFLHYNDKKGKFAEQNIYDGRIHLGLPSHLKR